MTTATVLALLLKIPALLEALWPLLALVVPLLVKAYLDEKKLAKLLTFAEAAYWSTEGIVARTPNAVDDKLHESLGRVMEMLGRPLKDREQRLVTARFAELAGRQKVATKIGNAALAAGHAAGSIAMQIAGPNTKQ